MAGEGEGVCTNLIRSTRRERPSSAQASKSQLLRVLGLLLILLLVLLLQLLLGDRLVSAPLHELLRLCGDQVCRVDVVHELGQLEAVLLEHLGVHGQQVLVLAYQ